MVSPVVLICISLMISEVVHFFIYLLVICMSSLEKSVQILCPLILSVLEYAAFYNFSRRNHLWILLSSFN